MATTAVRSTALIAALLLLTLLAGCNGDAPSAASDRSDSGVAAAPAESALDATAAAPTPAQIERETARLNEWFEARFEETLEFRPMQKTVLGRKDDYDKIDDLSEAAQDAQFERGRANLADLRTNFDYELLKPEAKISYDLWIYSRERGEAWLPFRRRGYMFHQMGGPHTSLPQFLINFHRVDDESDMVAYIARIRGAARAVEQSLARARLAAEEGVHAPRFAYEAVIEQSRALLTGAPFTADGTSRVDSPARSSTEPDPSEDTAASASPLWADAISKIDALVAKGAIDAARAAALRGDAAVALTEGFGPAYETLIAWAESELLLADEIATGIWKLPDGPAYYTERLATQTTTDMSADDIHALGLSEVARIKIEMAGIQEQVGFEGSLEEFFTFVREDPQFYLPSTDAGREEYLERAREHLGFIEARLPEYFGLLPKADLVVKRVEPFRERPGAAQHYNRSAPDGSRPGVYYAHLIDMSAMPIPQMEVIAYHEGIPGHHMQISIAQELTDVPTFRTQAGFTAFSEGWGLYSELLAKEMGAYSDPYHDFGRLTTEIWRAIRLVVDTGLHARGWTEEQAVEYFLANSPASEGQIRAEVQRYIVMPGQATAYKIGMLKILELRARAEAALGEGFDIRGFHDSVLGGGALPLAILERRVDAWIAERLGA